MRCALVGTSAVPFEIGAALAFGDSSSTYGLIGTTGFADPTGNLDFNLSQEGACGVPGENVFT